MENKKKWLLKKDQLLILLLVGVLLLIIALPGGEKKSTKEEAQTDTSGAYTFKQLEEAYIKQTKQQLEEVLSQTEGVGEVSVMITLKSSTEKIVEKDLDADNEIVTETDSQGGTRSTQGTVRGETTVYQGGSQEKQDPYIRKEISPQIEGVVVVATGGNNAVVVKDITEAVQALFTIDTHKIKIMKKH